MNNRKTFIAELQQQVTVIGVSKNHSISEIWDLHEDGIKIFGENRVQELSSKYIEDQPWDWHFIGHLQKNKVAKVIKMVSMIHSIDSVELVDVVEKNAKKINKKIDVLVQLNIIEEETKFGCSLSSVDTLVNHISNCEFTRFKGFMVMGPTNQDSAVTRYVFKKANELFAKYKKTHPSVDTLSMGMSSDYLIAIEHGTTMLRLGSILFNYSKNAQPQ